MKHCGKCGSVGHSVRTCDTQKSVSKQRAESKDKTNIGWSVQRLRD